MTMPHLSNCSHMGDGWCIPCVKAMWEEHQAEVANLLDCAQQQEQGIGAKTMRVALLPKPDGKVAVCVTFPSGMEDGERRAAETAVNSLALVYETAKALREADQPDYRELLKKFIAYLQDVEGSDFITPHGLHADLGVQFTAEEWAELEALHGDV